MNNPAPTFSTSGRVLRFLLSASAAQALPYPVSLTTFPIVNHTQRTRARVRQIQFPLAVPEPSINNTVQDTPRNGHLFITTPDSNPTTFLTPTIILTLVLVLIFSAILITVFFYGGTIRSYILQKLGKQKSQPGSESDKSATPSFGFGFDGLSASELEALRLKEEKEAAQKSWFIKLPTKPPSLVLKHSPLPPIQLDYAGHEGVMEDVDLDDDEHNIWPRLT